MILFHDHDAIGAERWDAVVTGSPNGWAYSTSAWRRLILDVPPWGLEDLSFAACEGERVIGVMPLQYQAASRRMASTGWGPGGAVVAADVARSEQRQVFAALVGHAEALARERGATALEISTSPLCGSSLDAPWGVNPLVPLGYDDVSTQSLVADLRESEDALWARLSSNARQMVRRAESAGYRTVRGEWPQFLDDYYRVHVETYNRTGVGPHPRRYFEGIAEHMAPRGHAVLWVGLAPDGRPVAFHNDTRFRDASLYATGCSETAHLESGINYCLFWRAIAGARSEGCRWYEIGEVFPSARDGKAKGLTIFKSKFGGDLHRYFKARRGFESAALLSQEPVARTDESSVRGGDSGVGPWHDWLRATRSLVQHMIGSRE